MRVFLAGLGLSLPLIAGCAASSTRAEAPRTEGASSVPPRWSYLCFEASTVSDLNLKANEAGMRGWELVTSTALDSGSSLSCFRKAHR
jgi:hypothetical protein